MWVLLPFIQCKYFFFHHNISVRFWVSQLYICKRFFVLSKAHIRQRPEAWGKNEHSTIRYFIPVPTFYALQKYMEEVLWRLYPFQVYLKVR